jgi:hypothetical protein
MYPGTVFSQFQQRLVERPMVIIDQPASAFCAAMSQLGNLLDIPLPFPVGQMQIGTSSSHIKQIRKGQDSIILCIQLSIDQKSHHGFPLRGGCAEEIDIQGFGT